MLQITENWAITLRLVKQARLYGTFRDCPNSIDIMDFNNYPSIALGLSMTLKQPMVKTAIIVYTYLDFWWCYWPAKNFFRFNINFTVKPSIVFKIFMAVVMWKRAYYPVNVKNFLYWWAKLALTRPGNNL